MAAIENEDRKINNLCLDNMYMLVSIIIIEAQ